LGRVYAVYDLQYFGNANVEIQIDDEGY